MKHTIRLPRILLLPIIVMVITAACSDKSTDTGDEPDDEESYTLVVEKASGLWGYPETSEFTYAWVETIEYCYALKDGYSDLAVILDGASVPDSGSFLMDMDHTLVASCARRIIWRVDVADNVYYCCPAVGDDGTIYISTGAYSITEYGTVYGISPLGTILWSYELAANAYSPVIGTNGSIFVQDYENTLYAFSPSGDLLWTFDDFDYPMHPIYPVGQRVPAIAADGTVYAVADGLYAINPATGERLWRFNPLYGKSCRQPPVIGADGTIYVTIHQHDFYAVNPDGREKWHAQFDHDYEMSFTSPAIDSDGTIYLGVEGTESRVWAFNPDGTVKWKTVVTEPYCRVRGSPTVAPDGTIYISTKACLEARGKVIALSPSGTKLWEYVVMPEHGTAALDDVYSTPTVGADGLIYFGAETERFYALNPDGTLNWKTRLAGINWSSAAILPDGTLYIGTHSGNPGMHGALWALETTSMGYAASPWPCYRHDNKNTGRFGGP